MHAFELDGGVAVSFSVILKVKEKKSIQNLYKAGL